MLFFGLELPDTIVNNRPEAFVDFNFTFLFIHVGTSVVGRAISSASVIVIFSFLVSLVFRWCSLGSA